jgi:hypothetical protein
LRRGTGSGFTDREDVMHLELRYRSDIDLSQPAMQVEIRNHITRCLRDYPHGCERVITLAGVEHCTSFRTTWSASTAPQVIVVVAARGPK